MNAPAAPGVLDIGDWWPLECGGEVTGIKCTAWPLSIYNPPFAASIDLQFFFRVAQRNIQPICHVPFLPTQQSLEMASLSLDSLLHPQPYPSAGGPVERRPIAPNRGAPTVSSTHGDPVAVTPDVNLTDEPVVGSGGTQVHIEDSVHRSVMLIGINER